MSDEHNHMDEIKLEPNINLGKDFPGQTYEEWKAEAQRGLKGAAFEKTLITPTYEGIDLSPIYTQKDVAGLACTEGMPGFTPYTRGTNAAGHLQKGWEVCQQIHCSFAEDFNRELKFALQRGQTGIHLKLDRASRLGLNPASSQAADVGADGVSISSLEDFSKALFGIDLEKYPLHIEAGFAGLEMLLMLAAYCREQGLHLEKIRGSVEIDPLGMMVVQGELPVSLEFAFDRMALLTLQASQAAPLIKTIGVKGTPFHNAGADAVQELAYTLAVAVEYIEQMLDRGLAVDAVARNFRFTVAVGSFYFMEVAKLRAARLLWSRIVEAYGGDEESRKMTCHARDSTYIQTRYDPYVNVLRTTTAAFAAVVGGADSLQTNPFDELFGRPGEFSSRLARNTQTILKEESHLHRLIDPAGGSYYVEKLTRQVAAAAWARFQEVQKRGGMVKALQQGYPQAEIEKIARQRNKDTAQRKSIMVGINAYADIDEEKLAWKYADQEKIYKKRADCIKKHRTTFPKEKYSGILEQLGRMVVDKKGDIIQAGAQGFLSGATLEDTAAAMRSKTGESFSIKPLRIQQAAEIFEELRDAVEAYREKTGSRPRAFLAPLGPLAQHQARTDFSQGFFAVGGFEVICPEGFNTPGEADHAAAAAAAPVVVICSSDDTYPELVPAIARSLKERNPDIIIVLAGCPGDRLEFYRGAGVDEFIYPGVDARHILSTILKKLGLL